MKAIARVLVIWRVYIKKPAAQATGASGFNPLGIFRHRRVTGPESKLTGE